LNLVDAFCDDFVKSNDCESDSKENAPELPAGPNLKLTSLAATR